MVKAGTSWCLALSENPLDLLKSLSATAYVPATLTITYDQVQCWLWSRTSLIYQKLHLATSLLSILLLFGSDIILDLGWNDSRPYLIEVECPSWLSDPWWLYFCWFHNCLDLEAYEHLLQYLLIWRMHQLWSHHSHFLIFFDSWAHRIQALEPKMTLVPSL